MHDMTDLELIVWMEKRFFLTKSFKGSITDTVFEDIETELIALLNKYKTLYNIPSPIPRIRMALKQKRIIFTFFDKKTNKRVLLGHWLAKKEEYYEH